jgi:hypothetical protein
VSDTYYWDVIQQWGGGGDDPLVLPGGFQDKCVKVKVKVKLFLCFN